MRRRMIMRRRMRRWRMVRRLRRGNADEKDEKDEKAEKAAKAKKAEASLVARADAHLASVEKAVAEKKEQEFRKWGACPKGDAYDSKGGAHDYQVRPAPAPLARCSAPKMSGLPAARIALRRRCPAPSMTR